MMVDEPNNPEDNDSFFEDDDFLAAERAEDNFDPEEKKQDIKANLKEIWQQNPSLKIFAIVAGIAVLLITFMVFGNGDPGTDETSVVGQGGEVTQPPGTAELPPAYEDAVRQANEASAETAAQTGGSSIPTPIARPSERIEAPVQVEESDPLSEWRREAESRREQRQDEVAPQNNTTVEPPLPQVQAQQDDPFASNPPQQTAAVQNPPLPTGPTPDMVNTMAQQISQQMTTVMETQIPRESVLVSMNIQPAYDMTKYYPPADAQNTAAAANGTTGTNNSAAAAAMGGNMPAQPPKPIVQAGTIAYAQILTQANSDVPGPVLAEIASGPLMGGRALGQFQVAEEHLVLQFNRVVKDGVEYPAQAYALDPGTTLPGVVTDIDHHYFSRVFLPAAARFIQGFANAAAQTDTTTVVSNGTVITDTGNDLDTRQEILNGVNTGAQELADIIDQDSDRPITVKVAAGTRIGILFVSSVFDPNATQNQQQQQNPYMQSQYGGYAGQAQAMGQNFFNSTPAGQVYNAYNSYNAQNGNAQNGQANYISTPQIQRAQLR